MRVKTDPYIFFSILFILLVFLLVSYPVIGFLPTYVSSPRNLLPGSNFVYYASILEDLMIYNFTGYVVRLNLTYVGSEEYLVDFTLYELFKFGKISVRPLSKGGFSFTAEKINILCNTSMVLSYQNSSVIRLVMPKTEERVSIVDDVEYLPFNKTGTYMGRGLFSLSYPEKYLGFARTYVGVIVNTTSNNTDIANNTILTNNAILVHINGQYLAYQVRTENHLVISQAILSDFGHKCPVLHDLIEAELKVVSEKLSRPGREMIMLNYSDVIPSDQAWAQVFWDNFNSLAPLSYALVTTSILLIILRARRG